MIRSVALSRRASLVATITSPLVLPRAARAQEPYPSRPIRMVLPYGPGVSDTLGRSVADHMRQTLGQPIVVENRPGSNGVIGAEIVARAPKDGYTIGYMAYGSVVLSPALIPDRLPYTLDDFKLLTAIFRAPNMLAIGKNFPARTLQEFLEVAKRGRPIPYGTVGQGGSGHLLMETLRSAAGGEYENVVYRSEPAAVLDVVAGTIPASVGSLMPLLTQYQAGEVRILAVTSPDRLPIIPDVPTFRELGFDAVTSTYFHSFAVPAGTPPATAERIHEALAAGIRSEQTRSKMTPDMTVAITSPAVFEADVRREIQTIVKLVHDNNIRIE